MRKFFLVLGTLGLSTVAAVAATIADVRFEQSGDTKLPEELFRYNVQQRAGQEYNPAQANEDLKSLFETGYIEEPSVRTETLPDGRIQVTYQITPRPIVAEVNFEGNKKIDDREIRDRIKVVADMPLNDALVSQTVKALHDYYVEEGYNEATVTPRIDKDKDGRLILTFVIDEKLRYRVNDVTFENGTVFSNWDLKYSIANRYSPLGWLFPSGLYNPAELEYDKLRIRNKYWDKGYLDFKVESVDVTPKEGDPEMLNLKFVFFEGEPYQVGKVTVSGGGEIIPDEELAKLVPFQEGETFDYQKEEAGRAAIAAAFEHLGHADVNVSVSRDPDFETHVVNLSYQVTPGGSFRVNRVEISGNEVTKDDVIRRELAIHDTDVLDPTRIEISRQRLLGMGYFNKVDAYTTDTDDAARRNVHFDVEEKRAYNLRIGGEYSDVDSLAAMVSLSNNNFDLFAPEKFFTGGGQRLQLSGIFGFHGGGADLAFTEPWLFNLPLRLDTHGYWNTSLLPYWNEERVGASVGLTHKIFDDFTSLNYNYKLENVRVYDMDIASLMRDEGNSRVSQFSVNLNRDTRDSMTNPTEGYYVNWLSAISPKVAGSSNNFYRLEASGAYYYSFFDKAVIWSLRGKTGVVSNFDRDDSVPLYERYFLGGGNSLRGFPWRTVSPLDNTDHPVGGQTMYVVSTEVTHPIWRFIRGAIFCDVGNSFGNAYSFGPGGVNMGVGYGFRIQVPMLDVPIMLDLAYPIISDQCSESRSLRFHFNLGYSWGI